MDEILEYMGGRVFENDAHKARELSIRFIIPYSMARAIVGDANRAN